MLSRSWVEMMAIRGCVIIRNYSLLLLLSSLTRPAPLQRKTSPTVPSPICLAWGTLTACWFLSVLIKPFHMSGESKLRTFTCWIGWKAKNKQGTHELILDWLSTGIFPVQASQDVVLSVQKLLLWNYVMFCLVSPVPNGLVSSSLHQILAPILPASADAGNSNKIKEILPATRGRIPSCRQR